MKILVVCQYYYPEPFRLNDICEELVKRGHDVTVVTGLPNYPMGEIYEGYQNGEKQDEVLNGVNVHRCNIIPRKTGMFYRFLNYYSFPRESVKYIKNLDCSFDAVFVYQQSPVMMAKAGIKYKKLHNKKLILYCLDIWPESLVAGNIRRSSPIYKYFHGVSKKIYAEADELLVTSRMFRSYFDKEFGIKNTTYLPQYAEELFTPEQCRKEPDGFIDLMFAGNVGAAQGVDTIIRAAAKCKDIENLRWHIVGDGKEIDKCKELANSLSSPVTFHGRKALEEMPKYYSLADAMIVSLKKDDNLSLTLPGKVQSYMAAGKPIIGVIDGEARKVISNAQCGYCAPAEDVEALVSVVKQFCNNQAIAQLGANSKAYYDANFSKKSFMDKLERLLGG